MYVRNFSQLHADLKYHYIAHTACDTIDEKASAASKTGEAYLGLLYTMEDLAVYGYLTNTRIKFVVVVGVPEGSIKDSEMRLIFKKIHASYIALVSNPFYDPDASKTITSTRFHQWMESTVTTM